MDLISAGLLAALILGILIGGYFGYDERRHLWREVERRDATIRDLRAQARRRDESRAFLARQLEPHVTDTAFPRALAAVRELRGGGS